MNLAEMLRENPYVAETRGDMSVEIKQVVADSRDKSENGLFFCIPGSRHDAHDFAPMAVANGCVALMVDHFLPMDVPQVRVTNARAAMSRFCEAFYGNPAAQMKLLAITGTKGKTTTSFFTKAILEKAGYKTGLIGTTGSMIGEEKIKGNLTTPDPIDLQRIFRRMANEGVEMVVMEVSAHAIDMCRLDGLTFDAACYTNLSQDHLDYFGTMDNYFQTKKRLFVPETVKNCALNVDDDTTARILDGLKVPCMTFGICRKADLFARDLDITENGVDFVFSLRKMNPMPVHLQLTGTFNVYNALSAASLAMIVGCTPEQIKEGLESVTNVPGRVEMLRTRTPYKVILDYSHSPDALENILNTAREFTRGRLIVLFGCGGDRDTGKRPMMGEIAGRLADYSILTSDNPRSEEPMAILAAIEAGIRPTGGKYTVIENRREAIRHALSIGEEGDVIILAGKGHETYQEIMGVKRSFDEKAIVQELLTEMSK